MVDDTLLSGDGIDFERYAMMPKPEHIQVDSVYAEQREQALREQLAGEPSVVVFTHDDADGLTSAALVRHAHRASNVAVDTVMYEGPFTLNDALCVLSDHEHTPTLVYILDFNFGDDTVVLDHIRHHINPKLSVRCFDHHQWENEDEVNEMDHVQLYVDDDECTATLLLNELLAEAVPQHLETLAEVTKDYDLWIREDARSGRLQTYANIAGTEEYIDAVLQYGVDFPYEIEQRIDEQERENERLVEVGVETAAAYEIGGYSVAVTYLGKGPSAEVGNQLVESEGHDIAVVQKAHGGGGIYSHSNEEGFTRCHEVAGKLGGGGHPTAAGFGHDFDDFMDLAAYWAMCGQHTQYDVEDAIRSVVGNDSDWVVNDDR